MSHEVGPEMDEEFAARMRRGLSAMAPREVARTRRIRRRAAGGALGALAIAVVTVLGVQAVGAGGQGGVEAVPTPTPTPSVTPTPEPSVEPTPEPTVEPTATPDPEPTPPPGFEGVAAGVPVVVDTYDSTSGGYGDTGSAGGGGSIVRYDVYVLCQGAGVVEAPWSTVYCAEESPSTVIARLGVAIDSSVLSYPSVVLSPDFTGTVRIVPEGQQPGGIGVGGVAAAWVMCPTTATIGDVAFTCTWRQGTLLPAEEAAWGIPYGPDQLVPRIVIPEGASAEIRLVLDPAP